MRKCAKNKSKWKLVDDITADRLLTAELEVIPDGYRAAGRRHTGQSSKHTVEQWSFINKAMTFILMLKTNNDVWVLVRQ